MKIYEATGFSLPTEPNWTPKQLLLDVLEMMDSRRLKSKNYTKCRVYFSEAWAEYLYQKYRIDSLGIISKLTVKQRIEKIGEGDPNDGDPSVPFVRICIDPNLSEWQVRVEDSE